MSLRNSFTIVGMISLLLFSVFSIVLFLYLNNVQNKLAAMTQGNLAEINAVTKVNTALFRLHNYFDSISKSGDMTVQDRAELTKKFIEMDSLLRDWSSAIQIELAAEQGEDEEGLEYEEMLIFNTFANEFASVKTPALVFTQQPDNPQEIIQTANILKDRISPLILHSENLIIAASQEFSTETHNVKNSLTKIGTAVLTTELFILLSIISVNILMSRYVTTSLEQFLTGTRQIAKGRFDHKIKIKGNNELSQLATSFNQMSLELNNATQYLENIINTMPNIMLITDDNNIIIKTNFQAGEIFNCSSAELIGKNITKILKIDKTKVSEILPEYQTTNIKTVKAHLLNDKKTIPVLLSSSTIISNNDHFHLYIMQDITIIEKMQSELVITAHHAGMADVATNLLHNVGNILNSVKTTIGLLEEKAKENSIINLPKVINVLEAKKGKLDQFLENDPKGQNILNYLTTLAEVNNDQRKYILDELGILKKHIDHITNIIIVQQELNSEVNFVEPIDLPQMFDEILNLNLTSSVRNSIEIVKDYDIKREVMGDRIRLMQVLINIVKNAFESLLASQNSHKKIKISTKPKDKNTFTIQISDSGLGVAPENLVKIFSHGFTTKKKGHGFGLHGAALAIKEMGGSIQVSSAGVNKGAEFTIILPYNALVKKSAELKEEEHG